MTTGFARAVAAEAAESRAHFVWEVERLLVLFDNEIGRASLSIGLRLQIEEIETWLGRWK